MIWMDKPGLQVIRRSCIDTDVRPLYLITCTKEQGSITQLHDTSYLLPTPRSGMSPLPSIPKTQTAAIVSAIGGDLIISTSHPVIQPSDLAPGECLIKVSHTGVCHTDLHAKKGDWPIPPSTPLIGGHEGVGEIVAIADNTVGAPVKVGDRVGIKWLADSCLNCEFCKKGYEMSECDGVYYAGTTMIPHCTDYLYLCSRNRLRRSQTLGVHHRRYILAIRPFLRQSRHSHPRRSRQCRRRIHPMRGCNNLQSAKSQQYLRWQLCCDTRCRRRSRSPSRSIRHSNGFTRHRNRYWFCQTRPMSRIGCNGIH